MAGKACISSLPAEVQALIVEQLVAAASDRAHVSELALVSPTWQDLVERHTFADVRLDQDRVVDAYEILTPRRQALVRNIHMDVVLDEYGEDAYGRAETVEEQSANSAVFTRAIEDLALLLSLWEDPESAAPSQTPATRLALHLDAFSPSDWRRGDRWGNDRDYIARRRLLSHQGKDIGDERFRGSVLAMDEDEIAGLPELPAIREFSTSIRISRGIEPRLCFTLATKMPNLVAVNWKVREPRQGNPRRQRESLADCISLLPPSVRQFSLGYNGAGAQTLATDAAPQAAADGLSIALRGLAQRLTKFSIIGVSVGPEVFWPSAVEEENDASALAWPHLEAVRLVLAEHQPDGKPLFRFGRLAPKELREGGGDGVEDDEDGDDSFDEEEEAPENLFNAKPVGERIDAYYIAAAHAMARMPRLKGLSIIWGAVPSYALHFFRRDGPNPYLWLRNDPVSEVSDEVKAAWLAAATEHPGFNDLEIGVGSEKSPQFGRPRYSSTRSQGA